MIPLAVPNLTGREREYLNRCIDTTFVSSVGEYVNKIEEMSAELCNTACGVATSSGTTGLHLALTAVGVKRDELVIIPSFTFIATANSVAHCGAEPLIVDVTGDTWTIDIDQVERILKEETRAEGDRLIYKPTGQRIAAIMPVYTLGNIPDMRRLSEIAGQYALPVIADAACAIGAEKENRKVGEFAGLTVLSFNGNKTVTAGGGGMVLGDDEPLMKLVRHLSTTARVTAEYDFDMTGFNYRMTNLQAAVGCAQLERLEEFVERKRQVRRYYEEAFSGLDNVLPFPTPSDCESACWFSGIVLKEGGPDRTGAICVSLKEKGIEARSFWKPIHLQKPYIDAPTSGDLKISDNIWDRIITLPCSTQITDEELKYVVTKVKETL